MENIFVPKTGFSRDVAPEQIAFEAARVRGLLKQFGLSAAIPELTAHFRSKWGGPSWLTFESFHEMFPTFPIVLEAHWFHHIRDQCTPAKLFRSFDKTFLLQRYLDVHARGQEEARGRPIGMVMPFDRFTGGMIMHNGCFDTVGVKMIADLSSDTPPHRVVVEPYISFIKYLARGGWTPSSPFPKSHEDGPRRSRCRIGSSIMPWMVRMLGCGPDTVLLGFFLRVLRSKAGDHRALLRLHKGHRWVALEQRELAELTGLSEEQVRRSVARLRNEGLLATCVAGARGHAKTHSRLLWEALREARLACR